MHWRRKWQPTPTFLPGESQGWWSRLWGGLPSMRSHRVGHDWSDLAVAAVSFSDLLPLVWQSLGPSTLLQMASFLFFFLQLNNITSYIYVLYLLHPFLCPWTLGLLSCSGFCKQCCCELWGVCILLTSVLDFILWLPVMALLSDDFHLYHYMN